MPTSQELNTQICFVHHTNILPPNGTMIPGNIVRNGNEQVSLRKHKNFLKHVPNQRMSIHWFVNDLVALHEENNSTGKYVIIERAKFLRPQLYGGYAEDFFCIGPYRLSAKAVIFVPEDEIDQVKIELNGFEGKIISYSKSQSLKKLVKEWINQNSTWQITIPENQTIMREFSTDVALSNLAREHQQGRLPLLVGKAGRFTQRVMEAKKQGVAKFNFEDDRRPNELVLHCNNKEYSAKSFFQSWYTEGMYYGAHDESTFGMFELYVGKLIAPLQAAYQNPHLDSLEGKRLPDSLLVIPDAASMPLFVKNVRESLVKIKAELIKLKMPAHVLAYFKDQWEINFAHWLRIFDEDILNSQSGRPRIWTNLDLLEDRIVPIRNNFIPQSGEYTSVLIGDQSTAALLSDKLKVSFSASKKEKSTYVDAVAELPKDDNEKDKVTFSKLSMHLRTQNIPFVFFKKDKTIQLVIPKINVKEVAVAVREAEEFNPVKSRPI